MNRKAVSVSVAHFGFRFFKIFGEPKIVNEITASVLVVSS